MNNERINKIIEESINKVLNEDIFGEAHHDDKDVASLIKHYLHKHKTPNKKIRKKKGGGEEYYNYDEYQIKNKKLATGDASSISNSIDMEKTNIASVARDLFPDHTEEGAQSQLRKILNGERPMTKKIASKIEKMISAGQIAVNK